MKKIKNLFIKYKEIINYMIFGILTTIISIFSYYILVLTILNPNNPIELQIANIASLIVSVTFAYITNRKYVFNSKNNNIFKEIIKFYSSRLFSLLIDMLIMYIFVSLLSFNDKIIKILVQIIVIILNYILSKLIVFNSKKTD